MDKSKWLNLTKAQQIGNIGSEIARAAYWEERNDIANRNSALERSLELLDLTLDDRRWNAGIKEIARFREVVGAKYCNNDFFNITLKELKEFCINFVMNSGRNSA